MKSLKKIAQTLVLLVLCLVLYQCGGVVGHIKFYDFRVSKPELESAIRAVMKNHPELDIPKQDKYVFDYDSFSWFCYIKDENGEEIFSYSFYGDSTYWKNHPEHSRLALIAMGKRGETISFKTNYFPTTKWRMLRKFEKNFIDRLKEQIETPSKHQALSCPTIPH